MEEAEHREKTARVLSAISLCAARPAVPPHRAHEVVVAGVRDHELDVVRPAVSPGATSVDDEVLATRRPHADLASAVAQMHGRAGGQLFGPRERAIVNA